jgi:hypothetical protein
MAVRAINPGECMGFRWPCAASATTTFDVAAQALLFGSQDKYDRMTAFLQREHG